MTYQEIKNICKKGKIGLIPKWIGYLKWDYAKDQIYFVNKEYIISQDELENKYQIDKRNDLYYII